MATRSTRLRCVQASNVEDLSHAVDALPFKVEIKSIVQNSEGKWVCLFVIPDEVPEFQNLDLGE